MRKIIIALCMALICLLTGCSRNEAKFVGSRDTEGFSCDTETYQSVGELLKNSELIVIGTAGKPKEVTEEFYGEILYASKIQITIKEVLKGTVNSASVNVLQTGKPNSDNYETKLKENGEYLLFLNSKTFCGETVYDCTGIEQGIVEINPDSSLYSYADFGISATFDNKSVKTLKEELVG